MRALKAIQTQETKKVRRVKKNRPVENQVTVLTAFVTLIKFMDNALCHYISGIGLWLMCKELGITQAIFHHFTNWGAK